MQIFEIEHVLNTDLFSTIIINDDFTVCKIVVWTNIFLSTKLLPIIAIITHWYACINGFSTGSSWSDNSHHSIILFISRLFSSSKSTFSIFNISLLFDLTAVSVLDDIFYSGNTCSAKAIDISGFFFSLALET